MAIFVKTNDPFSLVNGIKQKIREHGIDTWSVDSDGDFTHNVEQWRYRAWIRYRIEQERIVFFVICRKDSNMSVTEYAVYHGRFVEMLLAHFDMECKSIELTPLATRYYKVLVYKLLLFNRELLTC